MKIGGNAHRGTMTRKTVRKSDTPSAWDRVFRAANGAHLFRCANCGRESMDADSVVRETFLLDRSVRERWKHRCPECEAPMPWMDERSYGIRRGPNVD